MVLLYHPITYHQLRAQRILHAGTLLAMFLVAEKNWI